MKKHFDVDLIFFGVQGAGKGTQVAKLWGKYGKDNDWFRIQTGDLFRALAKKESGLAKKVKSLINDGFLVPDDVVNEVVFDALSQSEVNGRNWVFDGFPRNIYQAKALLNYYKKNQPSGNLVVLSLILSFGEAINRIRQRLICKNCNAIASESFGLKEGESCKHCKTGVLMKRKDEKEEEAIRQRIKIFETQTLPIYEFFKENGVHTELVNAIGDIKDIHENIVELLNPYKVE